MNLLSEILLGLGIFINFISIVGLIRLPDVYTRLHAGTKATTLGSILIVSSIVIYNYSHNENTSTVIIVHSLIALALIIFTNPISAHAIARAAIIVGVKPEMVEIDEYNNPTVEEVVRSDSSSETFNEGEIS